MYKLTKSGKQTSHIQAFVWSYITISAWELSILSLTSNQDIIGFPNQSKAFTNSKQNIWIFLIAGNVGSGWQLCMLRNFHWTFSLKWLYLKSELIMLHTCFLMTIYSTCTRCILTEFSFILWCSLGHGRKFIKDAPSACRINGHRSHKSFWYETGNVLNKCWKETKAIVLMYFLPEVLFKKNKNRIAHCFFMNCKKKKKKTHSALQFSDLLQETYLFFFFWP